MASKSLDQLLLGVEVRSGWYTNLEMYLTGQALNAVFLRSCGYWRIWKDQNLLRILTQTLLKVIINSRNLPNESKKPLRIHLMLNVWRKSGLSEKFFCNVFFRRNMISVAKMFNGLVCNRRHCEWTYSIVLYTRRSKNLRGK